MMSLHACRVDSNTFTMGNPMPESTLTLCQSLLDHLVRDFGFGLWTEFIDDENGFSFFADIYFMPVIVL